MKIAFSPQQKKILFTCTAVYTAAYVCRMNLSAALGGIMQSLSLSMAQAGLLQTVFAAVYAAGQLINGTIVDRVNPAKYMLIGIAGTAASNLLMGMFSAYPALLVLWSLNAAFQSMMWTPIVRMVAMHFPEIRTRERANELLALSLIVGHFVAWAAAGFLCAQVSWRLAFAVPGMIALAAFGFGARALLGGASMDAAVRREEKQAHSGVRTLDVLAGTGFFLVMITCLCFGFIRDGIITWTPTILNHIGGGEAVTSTAFSLILPMINICGVVTGFALRRRGARPHGVAAWLMALGVVCAPVLMFSGDMLVTAVLLGMICAGLYGANTMMTALIPLEYSCVGKTGLTAGLVDSLIYAGSAFSGVLGGSIYEVFGHNALYGLWAAASALSLVLMSVASAMSMRYWRRFRDAQE